MAERQRCGARGTRNNKKTKEKNGKKKTESLRLLEVGLV
jgi:hypothetical protein